MSSLAIASQVQLWTYAFVLHDNVLFDHQLCIISNISNSSVVNKACARHSRAFTKACPGHQRWWRSTACTGSKYMPCHLCPTCAGSIPCLWHGAFGTAGHPGHQQLFQYLLPVTRQVLARLPGVLLVFPPAHHVCHVDDGASAAYHSVQAHAAHAAGPCRQVHAQDIRRYAHCLCCHMH